MRRYIIICLFFTMVCQACSPSTVKKKEWQFGHKQKGKIITVDVNYKEKLKIVNVFSVSNGNLTFRKGTSLKQALGDKVACFTHKVDSSTYLVACSSNPQVVKNMGRYYGALDQGVFIEDQHLFKLFYLRAGIDTSDLDSVDFTPFTK